MYNDQAELVDKIDQNEEILTVKGYDQSQIVFGTSLKEIIFYDIKFKKQKRKISVLSRIKSHIKDIQLHKRGGEKSLIKVSGDAYIFLDNDAERVIGTLEGR